MKIVVFALTLLLTFWGLPTLQSQNQVNLSPWEMNKGKGHIPVGKLDMKKQHGNPIVYQLAKRPAKMDPNWTAAPHNSAGQIEMKLSSTVPCFQAVDFTYFRAFIDIPKNFTANHFTVTIGQVDDGARMFIYNSDYPNGHFDPATDGRLGGKNFTVDFKDEIVPGEINTIMIVQMDDCQSHNNLTGGLTLKVNNVEVKPNPNWKGEHTNYVKKNKYAKPAVRLIPKSNWVINDGDATDMLKIRPDGKALIISEGVDIPLTYEFKNGTYYFTGKDPDDGVIVTLEMTEGTKNEMHLKYSGEGEEETYVFGRKRNVNAKNLTGSAWIYEDEDGFREELIFLEGQKIAAESSRDGEEYIATYTLDGNKLTITISEEDAKRMDVSRRQGVVEIERFDYFNLHVRNIRKDSLMEYVREE